MTEEVELSVRHQCRLLGVNRSDPYYQVVSVSTDELAIMARIDELHPK